MKKIILVFCFSIGLTFVPGRSEAVAWIIIQQIIKKVLRALDLAVQQLQNKTIWLQNAQKQLENTMSKLQLDEITSWVEKQRKLYDDYYTELKKVKDLIAYYRRVKEITEKQLKLVDAYKKAFTLFKNDRHFTPREIEYMEKVYTGIVEASVRNIDQVIILINSFSTQMTDAKRLELINAAADRIDKNYNDLVDFNEQNKLLSLNRSRDEEEIKQLRVLYDIR